MEFKKQIFSGVKWTSFSAVGVTLLQVIKISVLAHLLIPAEFGLMSMMMVVVGIAKAFVDGGISNAIIYQQDTTPGQLSSLYWLNIFAGVSIFLIILLARPLIVAFFNQPRLSGILFWISFLFLIQPFGQLFRTILQKELKFAQLSKIEVWAEASGTAVAIGSAFLHQGVYSFVWGMLTTMFVANAAYTKVGWAKHKPSWEFHLKDLDGYYQFGLYQMGERSINYFSANVDYLLIGKFLGANILGYYTVAYQLVVLPLLKINPVLTKVAFPAFSKKQHDRPFLQRGYLEISRFLTFIVFPMLVGLAITAPNFVPVVYGKGWELSIYLVQILALLGMFKTLNNPTGSVLLALGRADLGFKWNAAVAVINTVIFWFAVQHGIFYITTAYLILSMLQFYVGQTVLIHQTIQVRWRQYLQKIAHPVLYTIVMGILTYALYQGLKQYSNLHLGSLLIIEVVAGIAIYAGLLYIYEYPYITKILKEIRS